MSQNYPQGKPTNYDKSLDRLTPKGSPSDPGLNAKRDFGSATHEVLNTTNKIMGGGKVHGQIYGTKAWQTQRPDDPNKIQLPSGISVSDFKVSQIPNTGPKFAPEDDNRVRPETRKIMQSSKMMITHGKNADTKGI